ncbi:MAG: extracellular solute-binding protein [Rhodobacteraceae bacterium]|nr:extracellular solute-binding protein [Paracoccaceae bacterium]MCY4251415.1 extracellular solute-binding protein [Paracoccaceae bacterium]MCY4309276.1 extracellular solute-binding protein [Paracoccaceae bacterium]
MKKFCAAVVAALLLPGSLWAACAYDNQVEIKSLSAGFQAWKSVTDAMAECGNFQAELDQEFRDKQVEAFAANPSLYHIGGVSNSTLVPLVNNNLVRPLDDLVAQHGGQLSENQLIRQNGQVVAIAMMVNAQHLMYRQDILDDLGIAEPANYEEVLAAAAKIADAGVVDYPLGATWKTGFNIALDFVNLFLGEGQSLINDDLSPSINNETGMYVLETMDRLKRYMDPEILVSDSTYVQQQFQQGKIAMANLWASRAAAMDDEAESQVVGLVTMASAPMGSVRPASTLWWDGTVIASNITDEEAEAAFRLIMEGMDREMVQANNDDAIWIIDGFVPGKSAEGAFATAANGAAPYPASTEFGIIFNALGNGLAAYITGEKDAATTLADIENEYLVGAKEAGLIQ